MDGVKDKDVEEEDDAAKISDAEVDVDDDRGSTYFAADDNRPHITERFRTIENNLERFRTISNDFGTNMYDHEDQEQSV